MPREGDFDRQVCKVLLSRALSKQVLLDLWAHGVPAAWDVSSKCGGAGLRLRCTGDGLQACLSWSARGGAPEVRLCQKVYGELRVDREKQELAFVQQQHVLFTVRAQKVRKVRLPLAFDLYCTQEDLFPTVSIRI